MGIAPLTEGARRDLLELLDDRYNARSTVITGELPVAQGHDAVGDPTLADAILDRLVHNAYKIALHKRQRGQVLKYQFFIRRVNRLEKNLLDVLKPVQKLPATPRK